MNIYIRVGTPEFLDKVNEWLDAILANEPSSTGKERMQKEFERLRLWSMLRSIWNSEEARDEIGEVFVNKCVKWGIYPPIYTVETHELVTGYHSRPRILWDDKVKKIDDVEEILTYSKHPRDNEWNKLKV